MVELTHEEPPKNPETRESEKIWQEYLNACADVGHTQKQLRILDSQVREHEKKLDVFNKKVDSLAFKHTDAIQKERAEQIKVEKKEVGH